MEYTPGVPTTFTKGDLFETPELRAYAQACSCTGAMDVGVGVAFRKRWPLMAAEFQAVCEDKRFHLGDVFVWVDGETTVYNLGVQENWKARARLAALAKAVRRMVELASHAGVTRIGLHRIGTGLGGLEWPRVKNVLEQVGVETTVELVVFEQFIRARTP
jgi:O-acetyl-ADP-ribose deacetylase (regulator of RNase III)